MKLLLRRLIAVMLLWMGVRAEYWLQAYNDNDNEEPTSFEHFSPPGELVRVMLACNNSGAIHINYLKFSIVVNETEEDDNQETEGGNTKVECSWNGPSRSSCEGLERCNITTAKAPIKCLELNHVNLTFQCIPAWQTYSMENLVYRTWTKESPLYLSTPGFNSTHYPKNTDYECSAFSLSNVLIVVEFLYADIENGYRGGCQYDYLLIDPPGKKICGIKDRNMRNSSVKARSPIKIHFHTDWLVERKGAWLRIFPESETARVYGYCTRGTPIATTTGVLPIHRRTTTPWRWHRNTWYRRTTTSTLWYTEGNYGHHENFYLHNADIAGIVGGVCGAIIIIATLIYVNHRRHIRAQELVRQRRNEVVSNVRGASNRGYEATDPVPLQPVSLSADAQRANDYYAPPSYEDATKNDPA